LYASWESDVSQFLPVENITYSIHNSHDYSAKSFHTTLPQNTEVQDSALFYLTGLQLEVFHVVSANSAFFLKMCCGLCMWNRTENNKHWLAFCNFNFSRCVCTHV